MLKYICKRMVTLVPVMLAVSFITFLLGSMSSGDTARTIAEKRYDKPTFEQIEKIRVEMGLNKPMLVQYAGWLTKAVCGDFGNSYSTDKPVLDEIARHFPNTLKLALLAMLCLIIISFSLGVLSAVFCGTWIDKLSRVYCFWSVSMPQFWLGLILLYIFGARLGLISVLGGSSMKWPIIPALTMSLCLGGIYVRLIRTNMEEVLAKGYIRAARARGVKEYAIVMRHVMKNAMLPAINKLGIGFGSLLAGSAIIESIFSWNGIGKLALEAVKLKDYPMVQGNVLFMAALMVLINLVVDVFSYIVDPRLKQGWESA